MYSGNYTDYLRQKVEREAQQFSAWEKWNKEVQKQSDIIRRWVACGCQPGGGRPKVER
jgi:ATPase subunit of ABC transporter with duplicated ATPase domains